MSTIPFVALMVVAVFIQIGAAQNFHYITEVQHGHDYMDNGSTRHLTSLPVVLCSLMVAHFLQQILALFVNYR
ncbi:hypothetical protein NQ317_006593 [Molorchus minor]|uniref:Uncharacterized protein n=1 Tax=Molorchus minor TaxID=1323400 RepID=A0ABQ9JZM2_9CUCU|nr:hypothetical protein NQ317_006593 [Molorchus minor]